MKRPALQSIGWFAAWSGVLLIVTNAVDRLAKGDGLVGVAESIMGFVWVGWIFVLGAVPMWIRFRWLLARFEPSLVGQVRWRGAFVGFVWWLLVGIGALGLLTAMRSFSPDSEPTLATTVTGLLGIGAFGAFLGFFEGRAIERHGLESVAT